MCFPARINGAGCNISLKFFTRTHSIYQLKEKNKMALLPILVHPDERLHQVAKPVAAVDERIRKLAADMAETMYEARGIGLAATQVNIQERIIVIDLSEEHDSLLVLINPVHHPQDGQTTYEEGCLIGARRVRHRYPCRERARRISRFGRRQAILRKPMVMLANLHPARN